MKIPANFYAAAAILLMPALSSAQIKVITSGGFSAALHELLPQFEKATGITVTATSGASQGTDPSTIGAQLRRGVNADVVIMSKEGLAALISEKRIVPGSDVDLAQTPLGVSVRAGSFKPDIATVEAFKQTMLRAKSVTFPGSTTGIWIKEKLFPRLGIAEQMSGKITSAGVAAVARGEAEVAVQPVSELVHALGADFVGTVPKEIQYISVFTAAMVAGSKEPERSKRLIAFLSSKDALSAIQKSGMEAGR